MGGLDACLPVCVQFFLHPSGKIPDWHDAVEKAIFGFNQASEDALASLTQGRRLLDEPASSETVKPCHLCRFTRPAVPYCVQAWAVPLTTTCSALLCPSRAVPRTPTHSALLCPSLGCAPYQSRSALLC